MRGEEVDRSEEEFRPGRELSVEEAIAAYGERAAATDAAAPRSMPVGCPHRPSLRAVALDQRDGATRRPPRLHPGAARRNHRRVGDRRCREPPLMRGPAHNRCLPRRLLLAGARLASRLDRLTLLREWLTIDRHYVPGLSLHQAKGRERGRVDVAFDATAVPRSRQVLTGRRRTIASSTSRSPEAASALGSGRSDSTDRLDNAAPRPDCRGLSIGCRTEEIDHVLFFTCWSRRRAQLLEMHKKLLQR